MHLVRQLHQQMVLRKLDSYMQKNQNGLLSHAVYKKKRNELKINEWVKDLSMEKAMAPHSSTPA